MTVKELIDKLKTLDQDKEIGYFVDEYCRTVDIAYIALDDDDVYCIK